jgi:hypothetical protein
MSVCKYKRLLPLLVIGCLAAGCKQSTENGQIPHREQGVPPLSCTGAHPTTQAYVTGTQLFPIPAIPPPGKCQVVSDPVFKTKVSRVTDRAQDGYTDDVILNHYSKADYENSDGTRVLLLTPKNMIWHLYDTTNLRRLKTVALGSSSQPEPRWDDQDPALLYYVDGVRLMSLNVASGQRATIHDFSGDVPGAQTIGTGVEGDASVDRNRWCFMARDSGDSVVAVVAYDRPQNAVIGKKTGGIDPTIDWVGTSLSGRHCILGSDSGTVAHGVGFGKQVAMPPGANGHADLALTKAGRDVLVYQNNDTDWIAMADLDTGAETNLVQIPFTTNTDIGLHFSGNCTRTPGWVLVSTYGRKEPSGSHTWMDHHLFMVELKPGPRVWRVASTYSYMGDYWAEAIASVNRAGTRVYWGSNWGQASLDRIETFVALLPVGWPSQVPP